MRWFVVALVLVLSACGGTEDPGVASVGDTPTSTAAQDAQAFTECMRDNGVDLGDPDPETGKPVLDPETVRGEEFQTALAECEELMPPGALDEVDTIGLEQQQAFAECVRENGLPDFPDPAPDGTFPDLGVDRADPRFQEAAEACQHLLAGG